MSVMLKTTNPDAVAEMDPDRDRRVPYIGQTLLYHARPGEGRAGRHIGVAKCINIRDDDMVDLIVTWDADDAIDKRNVPRKTDQNPFNSWGFTEHDDEVYLRPSGEQAQIDALKETSNATIEAHNALQATVEGHGRDIETLKNPVRVGGAPKK